MTTRGDQARTWVRALRPRLKGRVRVGKASHARDFGRVIERQPLLVVESACEADVQHTLAFARSRHIPVAVQGFGHSNAGQSLGQGILLRNVTGIPQPIRWLEDDQIEIAARDLWQHVEFAANRRGRAIPVLADYLRLAVGGTLSVGGYGVSSLSHGAQVDSVERLRLVQPDGTSVWCSRDEHSELFRFSLAGLGQVGVIERAVLRTKPHRPFSTLFVYRHPNLAALVGSLAWLTDPDDESPFLFKAIVSRGRYRSVYGRTSPSIRAAMRATPPRSCSDRRPDRRLVLPWRRRLRSLTVDFWVGRYGGRQRVWSDFLLTHSQLTAFATFLDELRGHNAFARCLKAIYILGVRRPANALPLPFEAAGTSGETMFLIGLYAMVPPGARHVLAQVHTAMASCLERATELGGRPYLYGWHALDATWMRRLYGDDYARLLALKQTLDPDGIFQPSWLPRPSP